jgi:hypothetical protein
MEIRENLAPTKEVLTTAKEVIELVSKVMLGGLAVCYALGLLVVNLYYSRFGVYSLSLFRVTYVAAGVWILLPISFVIFAIVTVMFMLDKDVPRMDWRHMPSQYRIVVGVTFLLFLLVALVALAVGLEINLTAKQYFFLLFSSSITGTLIVKLSVAAFITRRRFLSAVLSILLPMCLILHTISIAGAYGAIPAHLGGGGTKDVQFLLAIDENDKSFFERSGLLFEERSHWTYNTQLLFATDDEYVVLVKPDAFFEGSTLSIKRDLVKSVLYQGLHKQKTFGEKIESTGDTWDADTATPPKSSPTVPPEISPAP